MTTFRTDNRNGSNFLHVESPDQPGPINSGCTVKIQVAGGSRVSANFTPATARALAAEILRVAGCEPQAEVKAEGRRSAFA